MRLYNYGLWNFSWHARSTVVPKKVAFVRSELSRCRHLQVVGVAFRPDPSALVAHPGWYFVVYYSQEAQPVCWSGHHVPWSIAEFARSTALVVAAESALWLGRPPPGGLRRFPRPQRQRAPW